MKNIIVGIDGNESSKRAAREAIRVAQAFEAKLHFVTVVRKREVTKFDSGADHWIFDNLVGAQQRIREFLEAEGYKGEHTVVARSGKTTKALLDEAIRLPADLIVVGNADTKGLQGLLGSVSGGLRAEAPCNVLVVKTT